MRTAPSGRPRSSGVPGSRRPGGDAVHVDRVRDDEDEQPAADERPGPSEPEARHGEQAEDERDEDQVAHGVGHRQGHGGDVLPALQPGHHERRPDRGGGHRRGQPVEPHAARGLQDAAEGEQGHGPGGEGVEAEPAESAGDRDPGASPPSPAAASTSPAAQLSSPAARSPHASRSVALRRARTRTRWRRPAAARARAARRPARARAPGSGHQGGEDPEDERDPGPEGGGLPRCPASVATAHRTLIGRPRAGS
jgi:hypothetical protein